MNKNTNIILILILVIIALFFYTKINKQETAMQEKSIVGCYVARIAKDVYTLKIASQENESISGSLDFKNFEKDSSSGNLDGMYRDGIILGMYSFKSEGADSFIQVIFKKVGDGFVRGYGDMSTSTNRFLDINNVTYDSNVVFSNERCR